MSIYRQEKPMCYDIWHMCYGIGTKFVFYGYS